MGFNNSPERDAIVLYWLKGKEVRNQRDQLELGDNQERDGVNKQ